VETMATTMANIMTTTGYPIADSGNSIHPT
jgi:hypothetical protein